MKKIEIKKVFDFPKTNSKITKSFCNSYKGKIPVYASSMNEDSTIGYIEDNLKSVKYYEDCLSWNRNGSVGYVFVRNHRFATNEDHRALIIKDRYKNKLNKLYLKFEIERQLFFNGFSFLDKCGVAKIKKVLIQIPMKKNDDFDLEKQEEIAKKYVKIKNLKNELNILLNDLLKSKIYLNINYKIKPILITDIFEFGKGDAKYTKKYMNDNKGKYPVYSSQTSNFGEIGKINNYDYDEECFTWTTDGTYVGTVFYRNEKFSMTTHCRFLKVKEKYKKKLDFEYLNFILNQTLPKYKLGEGSNKRLGIERMKEIFIEIPVKKDGKFDLNKQREIADKYKKIEQIKKNLQEDYKMMINSKVQIIENEE